MSPRFTLVTFFVFLAAACREQPPEVRPNETTPGKREYVWSIDSVDFGDLPSKIELESIWGSSATDVWGVAGDAPDVRDCLWHYKGTKWARATAGTPITDNSGNKVVYAVWGSSQNDVWAFGRKIDGDALSAFIMQFDGVHWSDATPANVQTIAGHLYNVQGTSRDDIWVGGYEYALHFDGSQWSTYKVGDSLIVGSISQNTNHVYLNAYSPWGRNIQLAYLFDGSRFNLIDSTTDAQLKFAGLFWATDTKLNSFANGLLMATILADGKIDPSSWKRAFTTPTFFTEKYIQSPKDIFAVGQWNLIYHFNGSDWKQIFVEVPGHSVDPFALFWGIWSDGNEVFVCDTENGIVYHGR